MSANEHQSYLKSQLQEARHDLELARIDVYIAKQQVQEILQSTAGRLSNPCRVSGAGSADYLQRHKVSFPDVLRLYDATHGVTVRSLESKVRHCRNVVELRERELREAGAAGGGLGV